KLTFGVDAFGPASAVVAELFESLQRNRILARNVFSTRRHRGCLRRCTGKHRLNGVRTRGSGSRTDVWRRTEGRKEFGERPYCPRKRSTGSQKHNGKLRPK